MPDRDFERESSDLDPVADWLRAQRPEASAQDLDRIKLRAKAQANKPSAGPRRALSAALASVVLAAGLGGALAIAGKGPPASPKAGNSQGSAAVTAYKPGKGCGDKNALHERENECNKPPKE